MPVPLDNRKQSRENNTHISKGWIMDACRCLGGVDGYKLLLVIVKNNLNKKVKFKDLFL